MAQAYCVQLEQKLRAAAPQEVIEQGIRQYVGLFGVDEGIMGVFGYFKNRYKTNLDFDMLKQGSYDSWTPAIVIDDITTGI
jgi:hypothetical protein